MSSRSDRFECRWQASRLLLTAYLIAQALALVSLYFLDVPDWAGALGVLLCLMHGGWALPRFILLSSPSAFTGLRRDADGWQLWSARSGWKAVQLRRDSLALPFGGGAAFSSGRSVWRRWAAGAQCVHSTRRVGAGSTPAFARAVEVQPT